MDEVDWRKRIVVDPSICHGAPSVRGTDVTVGMIINSLAGGDALEQLLRKFPQLTREDVDAALRFAAEME